jgi:hypothetical protein
LHAKQNRTLMSEPLDYTTWTWEQHLAKACELAAKADQLGDSQIVSETARRLNDVQQVTARGWLHAKLAALKKPDSPEVFVTDDGPDAAALIESVLDTPAKTKGQQQARKRGV